MNAKQRPCGNKDCSVSTGICESLTFGYGNLDHNGYWEFPCPICEDEHYEKEKQNNENLDRPAK